MDYWARIELAHVESEAAAKAGSQDFVGMTIPARIAMPAVLADLVGVPKPVKKKRQKKASAQSAQGDAVLSDAASAH